MLRARFLICLIALVFCGALAAPAQQPTPRKKPTPAGVLPSKAPLQSEALRSPAARRPPPPPRPETVPLPYNMVWGDSQSRLASLFAGVGANVTNKKAEGKTETWTVQGLLAADLQTSFFTFSDHLLAGLEFDYGQASWDTAKYNDKMGQFRKLLEGQFGAPGEMISRPADDQPPAVDGVKQSLMGYQWKRGDTLAQLFYFSAEDPAKSLSFRSISVHYHYQEQAVVPMIDDSPLPGMENANPDANPLFGGKARAPAGAPPEPTAMPGGSSTPGPVLAPTPTPAASTDWHLAPDVGATPIPSPSPEESDGKGKHKTAKPTPPPYDPLPQ